MDKLLKMLQVDKLNESDQKALKEKIQTMIDAKATELSETTLVGAKEKLVAEMEKKYEDYKKDMTSKFSSFVDEVLEKELVIPKKILEFAAKGELYGDLIEQFKVRLAIDEGMLDKEIKTLLKDAKDEITTLRDDINTLTEKNLTVESDANKLALRLYLREKCDGLTEIQKDKVIKIMEDFDSKDEIDSKFDIVIESITDKKLEENKDNKDNKNGKGKIDVDLSEDDRDDKGTKTPFERNLGLYVQTLKNTTLN